MRLLSNSGLRVFAALIVFLCIESDQVCGQDFSPRQSRYRFVPDTPKSRSATAETKRAFSTSKSKFADAQELEFEDEEPEADFATAMTKPTAEFSSRNDNFLRSSSQPLANPSGSIKAASYVAGPKVSKAQGSGSSQFQGEGEFFDPSRSFFEGSESLPEYPFTDQFRSFPPRPGAEVLHGQVGAQSYGRRSYTGSVLRVSEQECCDEWSKFCPNFEPDYGCRCGGLKANPGHCIFKLLSSGEPCDEVLGCGRQNKCGHASGCGCPRMSRISQLPCKKKRCRSCLDFEPRERPAFKAVPRPECDCGCGGGCK